MPEVPAAATAAAARAARKGQLDGTGKQESKDSAYGEEGKEQWWESTLLPWKGVP